MIHFSNPGTHYVVAYGYRNNCETGDDILVLDPYNPDEQQENGLERTATDACNASKCGEINMIVATKWAD